MTPAQTSRGEYERTLDTYLGHFKSSQLLLGFYDAIKYDPLGLLKGVTEFLGISPFESEKIDYATTVNASPPHEMPSEVRECLVSSFSPLVERLADRFGSYASLWADRLAPDHMRQGTSPPHPELVPTLHP